MLLDFGQGKRFALIFGGVAARGGELVYSSLGYWIYAELELFRAQV
jgi:hypothetical protein